MFDVLYEIKKKKRMNYKWSSVDDLLLNTIFMCFCVVTGYTHIYYSVSLAWTMPIGCDRRSFTYNIYACSLISLNKILNIVKILTVLSILLILIHPNNKHVCM